MASQLSSGGPPAIRRGVGFSGGVGPPGRADLQGRRARRPTVADAVD